MITYRYIRYVCWIFVITISMVPCTSVWPTLTSLQALDLSRNYLTGQIPSSAIASLTSLEYFSSMNIYFKSIFPLSSYNNNSRLKVISLQMDHSEFQVDTESEALPCLPLFQLQVLHLANCKVNSPSGTFSSFLLHQHDLQYVDRSNNDLVGVFPNWLVASQQHKTQAFNIA